MKYEGPLYGKVGRKYIPLKQTSQDVDRLERLLDEAREALRWAQEQMGKHTRPSPIDNVLARIAGMNPNYVDAPMEVSVTTINPATGELKQGVARSEEELRTFFCHGKESAP